MNPIYSLNQSNQSSKKAPPNCFKNSYEIDANGLNGVIFKTEPCITFDDYQIQEQNLQPNPIVRPKVEKISRKRLERRLERLSNARSFNCASPNCNFSVYSKKKYINHLIEHRLNDDPPPFSCRNCKRTFYSFEKNSKHCCFQSERCYICFENFHCTKLIKHLHKAHRATSLKCAVGSCVEKFESVMLLNFHIRVVHHNQQLEHKCTSCPQQFRTLINRKLHMQRCQKVKLVCDICGYVGSRNLLVYHMKTHVKLKGEIVCRDCGAVTSNINTYSFHRVRAHGAEPKFKCPDCGLGFNRLFHVNRHRNRVHLKIDSK